MARTPWAPGAAALACAAQVVEAVAEQGRSLDAALDEFGQGSDRPAVRAIATGTVRWYLRLTPALARLLARPRDLATPVRALLACAAHQVEYSRNAPEATVHAAVDAVRVLRQPRAAGLVNAVLRRFVRERESIFGVLDAELAVRTAHPGWLVDALGRHWPDQRASVLLADNEHPPLTLRIDLTRTSVADYRRRLEAAGIGSKDIQWLDSGITLDRPCPVSELPGFADGEVSVQDAGAQWAAALLAVEPGQRVLDACAAPGGKTGHLLESAGGSVDLLAVDVSADRLALVEDNLRRLGRTARLKIADLAQPQALREEAPFDRILVDAPCSSTGVIRRHPDIKLLRRASDIGAFADTQMRILSNAAGRLAPGGRLVYGTCSVLPAENEAVVQALLKKAPHLRAVGLQVPQVPGAIPRDPGVQLLPGAEAGTDGFYYACLENTTTGT